MLEWDSYRRNFLNAQGFTKTSPGVWAREEEDGTETEYQPFRYHGDVGKQDWQLRAEAEVGPDVPLEDNGVAVLEAHYEPLEVAVHAACPFCGAEQQVAAWKRGVAQTGQKCRSCNAFVATGCWEAADAG